MLLPKHTSDPISRDNNAMHVASDVEVLISGRSTLPLTRTVRKLYRCPLSGLIFYQLLFCHLVSLNGLRSSLLQTFGTSSLKTLIAQSQNHLPFLKLALLIIHSIVLWIISNRTKRTKKILLLAWPLPRKKSLLPPHPLCISKGRGRRKGH